MTETVGQKLDSTLANLATKDDVRKVESHVLNLQSLVLNLIDAYNTNTAEMGKALNTAGIPVKTTPAKRVG